MNLTLSALQWELAEAALHHADAAREEADETAEELEQARADAQSAREAARDKAEQLQARLCGTALCFVIAEQLQQL